MENTYDLIKITQDTHLTTALELINHFAKTGIMLSQSEEHLHDISKKNNLFGVLYNNILIAVAGITFEYSPTLVEFGSWAVKEEHQTKGVGKLILIHTLMAVPSKKVIALGNTCSSAIFEKIQAKELKEKNVIDAVFIPCKTCTCIGKENLPMGRKCVDRIFDLSHLRKIV